MTSSSNIDHKTVEGFGDEWDSYDQTALGHAEWQTLFDRYFAIFPFSVLPENAEGFDLGCGSGRWASGVVDRVGRLHCIDPSEKALAVARRRLGDNPRAEFHHAGVDAIPMPDASQDFGYSLGVLHHIPDTQAALKDCVRKLKPGAPFLVYLYYDFDNKSGWFRALWRVSDWIRVVVSRLPFKARNAATVLIATVLYWPLARGAALAEKLGADVRNWPLSPYRHNSFYSMRTDALDRFGTRLEQRFSRARIAEMMAAAGLVDVRFSEDVPYWVAVGFKSPT